METTATRECPSGFAIIFVLGTFRTPNVSMLHMS
jgi:hypothetical protein